MKRILLPILGFAVLLCCSCSKEEETGVNNEQNLETTDARGHIVFYSTTGNGSKVGMVSRTQQGFHATDEVAILESTDKLSLYTVDVSGSTLATGSSLYSSAKLVYSSGATLTSGNTHYAVMPSTGAAWSGSNLSVVQNAKQYAAPGSQDSLGCIHYGKTTTNAIAFSNLSAMFRLVVVGENTTCDEIRLAATGISGTATITLSSGAISAGSVDTVSCKAVGNGKFAKDTTYYYGFLPGTYSSLTVTAYNAGSAIAGSAVTYSDKTWSSGAVYNIYLQYGKLYTKKSSLLPAGCLPGEFSVSSTKKVNFSMGNLQYTTTGTHAVATGGTEPGTWRFAVHQWDFVGSPASAGSDNNISPSGMVSGSDNERISDTCTGWIDLFGWGTSGWNSGATCYQPYSSSNTNTHYYTGGSSSYNLTESCKNADWGEYNAISNGGNTPGQWRTLTYSEVSYMLSSRNDASKLYGQAIVNGVRGTIFLPDNWTKPTGLNFTSGVSGYTNNYSIDQWERMEAAGAVFMPAAGIRDKKKVMFANQDGYYWSSTNDGHNGAYRIYFASTSVRIDGYYDGRFIGMTVRLVRNVE